MHARYTTKGRVCGKYQRSDVSKTCACWLRCSRSAQQGVAHMLCPASSPSLQTCPGPASPPAARAAPRLCMVCRATTCVRRLAPVLRPHLGSPVVPPCQGTRDRVASLLSGPCTKMPHAPLAKAPTDKTSWCLCVSPPLPAHPFLLSLLDSTALLAVQVFAVSAVGVSEPLDVEFHVPDAPWVVSKPSATSLEVTFFSYT